MPAAFLSEAEFKDKEFSEFFSFSRSHRPFSRSHAPASLPCFDKAQHKSGD
jgi:hypothetical protein